MFLARPPLRALSCSARAVSSQPPPGSAGAMIDSRPLGYDALSPEPPPPDRSACPHAARDIAASASSATSVRFTITPPRRVGRRHRDASGGTPQRLCALVRGVRVSRVLRILLTGTIPCVRRRGRRLSSQILVYQLLILLATLLVGVGLALRAAQSRLDGEFEQRALGVASSVPPPPQLAERVAAHDA